MLDKKLIKDMLIVAEKECKQLQNRVLIYSKNKSYSWNDIPLKCKNRVIEKRIIHLQSTIVSLKGALYE